LNKDNGIFSDPEIYSTRFEVTSISIGEINNDQKSDFIVNYYFNRKISVYFNMRNDTFTNQTIYSIPFVPEVAKLIDINDDGYMEIVVIGYIGGDERASPNF
jgi:hypothetical protein